MQESLNIKVFVTDDETRRLISETIRMAASVDAAAAQGILPLETKVIRHQIPKAFHISRIHAEEVRSALQPLLKAHNLCISEGSKGWIIEAPVPPLASTAKSAPREVEPWWQK